MCGTRPSMICTSNRLETPLLETIRNVSGEVMIWTDTIAFGMRNMGIKVLMESLKDSWVDGSRFMEKKGGEKRMSANAECV